jgi:putative phage-type endonuclease
MKTIEGLVQGTGDWLAHRRTTRNASDAPAMMGTSPYVSRSQLIKQRATGVEREIDANTQRIFDKGHEVEPKLRALAERLLGEDLFPITGVSDDGYLGASFDGVTMGDDVILEAKQHNAKKIACIGLGEIPPADYWQIVQQFAVCETAHTCLYLVGDGSDEGTSRLTILRKEIEHDIPKLRAGWQELDNDVFLFVPEAQEVQPVGRHRPQLPALRVQATGMVTMSNLDEFRAASLAQFESMNYELVTDQDFADAENDIKFCKAVEDNAKASTAAILSGTGDVDAILRAIADVAAEARRNRLLKENSVKARKDERRTEIGNNARRAVQQHVLAINESLGEHGIQMPATLIGDIGDAIKGKRSFASMQEAIDSVVANAKIDASQLADRVRANVAILAEHPDHAGLFADRVQLCASKAPEDLRNLVAARIAEEDKRLADQREKIRLEEIAKLQREQEERDASTARRAEAQPAMAAPTPVATPAPAPAPAPAAVEAPEPEIAEAAQVMASSTSTRRVRLMKLGEVNAAIAPLTISAEGLALLGFQPVNTDRGAKNYDAGQFRAMCIAMRASLADAVRKVEDDFPLAA